MTQRRPSIFVGSSAEGLAVAKGIQVNLDRACEIVLWSQGVFGLGGGTLETIVDKAPEFDFAVLVLTPDDMLVNRDELKKGPRDNVLLELGIFIGVLGRKRSMVVFDRSAGIKLPTDLAGVTLADYQAHSSGNIAAAVGAACTKIESTISELGLRSRPQPDFNIDQNTQFQIIADLLDQAPIQFLILMHEQKIALKKESMFEAGVEYFHFRNNRSGGHGLFSITSLCRQLPDAGLIQIDLRDNVTLTSRRHYFADWLVEHGRKADSFKSPLGGWGPDIPGQFMNSLPPLPTFQKHAASGAESPPMDPGRTSPPSSLGNK
jgi:hypothetical protein